MQILRNDTRCLLEKAINGYESNGADAKLAVQHLLIDLRHYCDQHDIDIDEPLEDSLDVYLEERDCSDD